MRRWYFIIILIILFAIAFFVTRNTAPSVETRQETSAAPRAEEPKVDFAPSIDNEPEARIAPDAIPDATDDVVAVNTSLRLFEPAQHALVP